MIGSLRALWLLLWANLWQYRIRSVLTIFSIAFSISLVIAMTSGYRSAEYGIKTMLDMFLGETDLTLRNAAGLANGLDVQLIEELKKDERVAGFEVQYQSVMSTKVLPGAIDGKSETRIDVMGRDQVTQAQKEMLPLLEGRWFTPEEDGQMVVMISGHMSELTGMKVGDDLEVGEFKLKVLGIYDRPIMLATMRKMVFVPLGTKRAMTGFPNRATEIMVNLHEEDMVDGFLADWEPRFETMETPVKAVTTRKQKGLINDYLKSAQVMSYMGGMVTLLAASFIVFSTLSMGVKERSRQLAMLRCIGATRRQIIVRVMGEGLLLGLGGALLGLPLGLLLLYVLVLVYPGIFPLGVMISVWGSVAAITTALLIALAASVLPAWSASRIDPVAAMSPLTRTSQKKLNWVLLILGLLMFLSDTFIVSINDWLPVESQIPRDIQIWVHLILGLPLAVVGLLLIAPLFVVLVEQGMGRLVAAVLRVRYQLLKRQLSGSMWRTVGTSMALLMGLSILVTMRIQSESLLSTIELPDRFPDMVLVAPAGLTKDQYSKLDDAPGIKKDQVMAMAVANAKFGTNIWGVAGISDGPQGTMFVGVDPIRTLGTGNEGDPEGMLELRFVRGDLDSARKKLMQGEHVIVTEEFYQIKNLDVGDHLDLEVVGGKTHAFKIAGVVRAPGVDLIVRSMRMGREFESWSGGTVFGALTDAEKYYKVDRILFFGLNVESHVGDTELQAQLREDLLKTPTKGQQGNAEGAGIKDRVTGLFRTVKDEERRAAFAANLANSAAMQVQDTRKLKQFVEARVQRTMTILNILPICALVIAALGVSNTIIASLRSRRWQLGVLRSIGMNRGTLFRLVLSEALLIGTCASVMGLGVGMLMAYNANQIGEVISGYIRPYVVPWDYVIYGVSITLLVAVCASLWPAIRVALTTPLRLLQEGRGSM